MTADPRVCIVVQARTSSSRLPGKALLPVGRMPMALLTIVRAANQGHRVLLATSEEPSDDDLAARVAAAGIQVHRGSLEDPLQRFATATPDLPDDAIIVRITADNVFPDGHLVSALVEGMVQAGAQYASVNNQSSQVPYGVSGEAFTLGALRTADREATDSFDREHITPWIRREHGTHDVVLPGTSRWHELRCTVDTPEDYVRIVRLLQRPDPVDARWETLCDELELSTTRGFHQGGYVLGTAQLGLDYGAANSSGQPDLTGAREILDAAHGAGATHVDTARAYGTSEERLGTLLPEVADPGLGIVTKTPPLTPDDTAQDVRDAIATSLQHLGTPQVDALLTHRAADWQRTEVRDVLVEQRDAGAAVVVGVSVQTPAELLDVLADADCGYVQLPFNVVDRRWLAPEVQQALADRPEVVVTVRSVFLQGVLASDTAPWPVAEPGADTVRDALHSCVAQLGRDSLADLCLAYVRGQRWVTSVVLGAETAGQVTDVAALLRRPQLTADECALVEQTVPAGSATLVDPARWT